MEAISLFRSPFLLGFDHLEEILNRTAKSQEDSYPPYNVLRLNDQDIRITLALAGFSVDRLEITVEGNQLYIRGLRAEETENVYLHRGIATRMFQRSFVLADGVEVTYASLDNGLLHIDVSLPRPEHNVRKIAIDGAGSPARSMETKGQVS